MKRTIEDVVDAFSVVRARFSRARRSWEEVKISAACQGMALASPEDEQDRLELGFVLPSDPTTLIGGAAWLHRPGSMPVSANIGPGMGLG